MFTERSCSHYAAAAVDAPQHHERRRRSQHDRAVAGQRLGPHAVQQHPDPPDRGVPLQGELVLRHAAKWRSPSDMHASWPSTGLWWQSFLQAEMAICLKSSMLQRCPRQTAAMEPAGRCLKLKGVSLPAGQGEPGQAVQTEHSGAEGRRRAAVRLQNQVLPSTR